MLGANSSLLIFVEELGGVGGFSLKKINTRTAQTVPRHA